MTVNNRHARVNKFLARRTTRLLASLNEGVRDPRSSRGVRPEKKRTLAPMLHALFAGMLACDRGLRDVEERSETLGLKDGCEPVGRIPDTTLGDLLAKLDPDDFERPLVRQVRDMNRRRELRPVELPCGVVTVDGKAMGRLTHDAEGYAMRQTEEEGSAFWYVRLLRAVLSSAAGKPCLGQKTIPGRRGEITSFPAFATWLHETYGCHGLFEIFDLDAGFFSRRLFTFLDQNLGYGLVVGLKGNQPELLQEAKKILGWTREKNSPELVTPWQRYQGTLMRRKLYRTRDRGRAVIVLGWLRLLAYNLTQSLRRRHLRRHHPKLNTSSPWRWRSLFKLISAELPSLASAWPRHPLSLPPSPS